MNSLPSLLANILLSLLTAFVASGLTAWVALRRFREDKWWEQKFSSYTAIFNELHDMGAIFNEDLESLKHGREFSEEDSSMLRHRYASAKRTLEKQLDVDEFLLSPDSVAALRKLGRQLTHAGPEGPSFSDYVMHSNNALIECLENLRILAKNDLQGRVFRRRQ